MDAGLSSSVAYSTRRFANRSQTWKKGEEMKTIGTMRALDQKRGAVRMEELYKTDIRDLWEACTSPERLARWLAQVSGDLKVGGIIELLFTSSWAGSARVDI